MRYVTGDLSHQTGDGGRFKTFQVHTEQLAQAIDIGITGHHIRAVALLHHVDFDLVFVVDLAPDLFQPVLDRDHTGHTAVFVDHDREVQVLLLHLAHERLDGLALRHKVDRLQQ